MSNPVFDELQWKKFPVLDDGHVCLVDCMGDDDAIIQAARISYGKGTRKTSEDRDLVRYLMRNHHMTPFEMAEIKLRVRVPMDAWRQWIRHRTANVNEYSTRYSEAIDSQQKTEPGEWRLQVTTNKQGSAGLVGEWPVGYRVEEDPEIDDEEAIADGAMLVRTDPETGKELGFRVFQDGEPVSPGGYLSALEADFHREARHVYDERLKFGVAREQARKDLPLSTYTEAYWKCDLRNVLHFLGLRMDSHAQKEIRDYANVIGREIIAPLFPLTWEAFEDYHLNAITLTRIDVEMIRWMTSHDGNKLSNFNNKSHALWGSKEKNRERDECRAKLERLGLL